MVEDNDQEFESGPFCIHWGDPGDCDDPCLRKGCGHRCSDHGTFDEEDACQGDGCSCRGLVWVMDGVFYDRSTGEEVPESVTVGGS